MTMTSAAAAAKVPTSVLLVDGDWRDCVGRAEELARRGWHVDVATSGDDALIELEAFLPDAIVTEVQLRGGFDGFELARRIKTDPRTRHVPVVVLTARPLAEVMERAIAAECSTCLSKPCEIETVVVAVNSAIVIANLLARRRAHRAGASGEPTWWTRVTGRRGATVSPRG